MPIERVEKMTQVVLQDAGRVDEEGRVRPIEVERRLHGGQWLMGPRTDSGWRTDILVPTSEETRGYIETDEQGITTKNRIKNPRFDRVLYANLTGRKINHLTEEQAAALSHDKVKLENTVSSLPAYRWHYSAKQLEDAYHVTAIEKRSQTLLQPACMCQPVWTR